MNIPESTTIPTDTLQRLQDSLNSLQTSLLALDPCMPNHLRETHKLLVSYPETVALLDDNEIKNLITAAENYTNVKIVTDKKTSGKAASARASRHTVDDI